MKKENEKQIIVSIRQQLKKIQIKKPVWLEFQWFERNKRRNLNNISSFGRKVIQDALVKTGLLKEDGWDYIVGFQDNFYVHKEQNQMEVTIKEIE